MTKDDLRFYVLLNSISVKSGQCLDNNEECMQWDLVYGWKDFRLKRCSNPGPLDQKVNVSPTELPGLLYGQIPTVHA